MIYIAQCINSGGCLNLQNYEEYYVYDEGGENFYVSRLPSADKSYFGSYRKEMFKVLKKVDKTAVKKPDPEPVEEQYQQIALF